MTDTTTPDPDTRHAPLEALHRSLGAKLGPFGGWLMPIEYRGVLSEPVSYTHLTLPTTERV